MRLLGWNAHKALGPLLSFLYLWLFSSALKNVTKVVQSSPAKAGLSGPPQSHGWPARGDSPGAWVLYFHRALQSPNNAWNGGKGIKYFIFARGLNLKQSEDTAVTSFIFIYFIYFVFYIWQNLLNVSFTSLFSINWVEKNLLWGLCWKEYYVSLKALQDKYNLSHFWPAYGLTSALKITSVDVPWPWTCLKLIRRNRYLLVLVIFTMDHGIVYNIHNNPTAVDHVSPPGGYTVVNQHTSGRLSKHLTHHHETPHTFYLCQMAHDEYALSFCWFAASHHNAMWNTVRHRCSTATAP